MFVGDNYSFSICFVMDRFVRREQWKRIKITKIYQTLNSVCVCLIHRCWGRRGKQSDVLCWIHSIDVDVVVRVWCEQRFGVLPTSLHTNVILAFTRLAQNIAFNRATIIPNIHRSHSPTKCLIYFQNHKLPVFCCTAKRFWANPLPQNSAQLRCQNV